MRNLIGYKCTNIILLPCRQNNQSNHRTFIALNSYAHSVVLRSNVSGDPYPETRFKLVKKGEFVPAKACLGGVGLTIKETPYNSGKNFTKKDLS